jgi:2-C-methyl-D-erythritol 4-phosphate cytidylyltransferase
MTFAMIFSQMMENNQRYGKETKMNYAIVLAGGQGERMGKTVVPKQFTIIKNKPILWYTLETIEKNQNIDGACVVAPIEWHETINKWCKENDYKKVKILAISGLDRRQSVHNGLLKINQYKVENVMIMTAVCPFVSQKSINQHFEDINKFEGCITVVAAVDAITFSNDANKAQRTLQKKKMFVQQGPQTYKYQTILEAHNEYVENPYNPEVNEDSELILNMGFEIGMVHGDRFCMKVTYPEDIAIVEALLPLFIEKELSKVN